MFVSLLAVGASLAFAIGWASFEATVVLLLTYIVIVLASIRDRVSEVRSATPAELAQLLRAYVALRKGGR